MNASGEEHLQLIEDCENRESRLSERDRELVDSFKSQIERGRTLTESQAYTLDMIWERATARG